ncbi:MAG: hypothetical protein GKR86_00240 [Ilumatobacter sp.]|nr:hypothetical protein [Ilumatobacter sp.]
MAQPQKRNKTTITPELRKTLPKRGKHKRTLMLEAIRAECEGGEEAYLRKVVRASVGNGKDQKPCAQLMQYVMQRIEPLTKNVMPVVNFKYNPKGDPIEQIDSILKEIASGDMPADIGNVIVSMIQTRMKIKEICEFEDRLKQLESNVGL